MFSLKSHVISKQYFQFKMFRIKLHNIVWGLLLVIQRHVCSTSENDFSLGFCSTSEDDHVCSSTEDNFSLGFC
jgi:hypothetical protein